MKINCTKLGKTYSIEFYGNLEENFYSFDVLSNLDNHRDIVFVEPSDYLNTFFKNKIVKLMSQIGNYTVVFE